MKNIIIILLFLSCGAVKEECGSDVEMLCNNVFGYKHDESEDISNLKEDINSLYKKVSDIYETNKDNKDYINIKLSAMYDLIYDNKNEIQEIGLTNVEHMDAIDALSDAIDNIDIRSIEVVELCPGSEEVLLLVDDTYVAYFQKGSSRYLAELSSGNYMTTDGTNCRFTINSTELLF